MFVQLAFRLLVHAVLSGLVTGLLGLVPSGFVIARPGDRFHVVVDGTVIDGHYVEVDPPHRIVIAWDRQDTDDTSPTIVEITFTPTRGNTNMAVEFIALSAEDGDFYGNI